MKFIGAAIVTAYAALAFSGYEPFTQQEKGALPTDARRGPGGALFWTTGFWGGK